MGKVSQLGVDRSREGYNGVTFKIMNNRHSTGCWLKHSASQALLLYLPDHRVVSGAIQHG